ncbi:UNVERIFIED_CONTAM: Golgin candidate 3 [Sesamum latifolium]|uniref:Golgin candidate 3 n=1 Tax=Sesamum latifolium TaxID=2727402 RepID=A0AAW2YGK5_9LAMI
MWSSVANLKESLSKIALDVHDEDDEELSLFTSPPGDQFDNGNSVSDRRSSRNFTRSSTRTHSPIGNGFDSSLNHEIEQYKTQIKRLQESEAEIKALSVNYAALLKEKEDQISRLTEENGSLKQNLLTTNAALTAFKTVPKGTGDISPNRHNKAATRIRTSGSSLTNGVPKYDGLNNGTSLANSNELSDTVEDKSRSLAAIQATHEAQMKKMAVELDKERSKSASTQIRLQEEQKLNGSLQRELSSLKDDNNKMLNEMHKTRDELNQRITEIGKLQMELQRKNREETGGTVERLKEVISTLEDENRNIKKEKDEFEAALKAIHSSPVRKDIPGDLDPSNKHPSSTVEALAENQEMQKSLRKLEKDLQETCKEREKALQELNRLKQHLLEKESEESEKMDEDSKIIDELREINEHQRVQISRLEKALKQAIGGQEEIKMSNNNELKKAKETIDELNRKLASCMSTIDAKNMEVLNLQTALGQYYAEIEAKERLCEELSVAKEESARLSKQLKEAHQEAEASKREKEEILGKLSQAERMLAEGKNRVKKLEEDNEKLRRALEQSMMRLNRMSADSDFLVDRLDQLKKFSCLKLERIVIKLLATYFQRNHSKEVSALHRPCSARAGKGVVRGVLGLPGRLVGGILRSGSAEAHTSMASDNQSFADQWVEFLLDATEREKRESASAASSSNPDYSTTGTASPQPDHRGNTAAASDFRRPNLYLNENTTLSPSRGTFLQHEHSDSEFSTVPLTSSESNSQSSRLLPRY